ncbi:hypothetical protein ATY81_21935 [Rhizobium sp. R72]|nr:hypothetical protein ATY81_21935 [Rhizobium sp. R72]OWW02449.1 hypothetical protein ATY80_21935 [Rhizobium sp. R711]
MIVVSLRDVRDDFGELGGKRRVKARSYDRRSRRAEDPILSERSEAKRRENWRGRDGLELAFAVWHDWPI